MGKSSSAAEENSVQAKPYFLLAEVDVLGSSLARPASKYFTHSSCKSISRSAAFILSLFFSSLGNFWRLSTHRPSGSVITSQAHFQLITLCTLYMYY